MTVAAYASMVEVNEWVFTDDRTFHVSMSNLPLQERTDAVTLCHLRAPLFRIDDPPRFYQRDQVCVGCVHELRSMGEELPAWMDRL